MPPRESIERRRAGRKGRQRGSSTVQPVEERSHFLVLAATTTAPLAIPWAIKILLIGVILLGAALRIANLGNVIARSPDERAYALHAFGLEKNGLVGNRALARAQIQNAELHFYPPPTRLAFTLPVAAIMRLTGIYDERPGAYLSCAASILSLAAAIWIGLRFFGSWIAVFGGFFLAVFPPELVIARRCWSDALTGLAGILTLYLTMEIFSGRRNWFFYVPLALIGTVAVLAKETSVLLYGPCLLVALWALVVKNRDFSGAGFMVLAAVVSALLAVALLVYSTGGVTVPLQIFLEDARANSQNPYALGNQSGPGYLLLWAFEALSPLTFTLAVLGLGIVIVRDRRARSETALLAWMTIGFLAIFMLMPLWLNLRYATAAYAPLCLFAGVALWQLFSMASRKLPQDACYGAVALGLAAILFAAYADYQRFENDFAQINDLSVGVIRTALSN